MTPAPGLERFERALVPALRRDLVRHTRRRRGATVAMVAVAAGVACLVGIPRLGGNGPDGSPLARAEAALAVSGAGVLHVRVEAVQENADGTTVSWDDESWRQLGGGHLRMIERGPGKPVIEAEKSADGVARVYDAATDTIYELGPGAATASGATSTAGGAQATAGKAGEAEKADKDDPATPVVGSVLATMEDGTRVVVGDDGSKLLVPAGAPLPKLAHAGTPVEPPPAWVAPYALQAAKHAEVAANDNGGPVKAAPVLPIASQLDPQAESFRTDVLQLLRSGAAHADGTVVVDGRRALRIVGSDPSSVYLVDASTYDPIGWDTQAKGAGVQMRITVYERLPAGAAATAALSLTDQHPSARIDRDPAHFQEAVARLYQHG